MAAAVDPATLATAPVRARALAARAANARNAEYVSPLPFWTRGTGMRAGYVSDANLHDN